jgi:acyl-CoA thioester hydrolase
MNMIVAHASCSYKTPAFLGELLHIGVAVTRFGNKSFDFTYRINTQDNRLIATAQTVQVAYDYQEDHTIALPNAFQRIVLDVQGTVDFPDI